MARKICVIGTATLAVALSGILAVGFADSAFAAKKKQTIANTTTTSKYQSREDWPPIPNMSAQFYRSGAQQRSNTKQKSQPKTEN